MAASPRDGRSRGVRPRRGSSDRQGSRSGTRRTGVSFSRRPAPSLEEQLGPACAGPSPRGLLFRVMAYRLQAGTFGDLDRKTVRLLERMADGAEENWLPTGQRRPARMSTRNPSPCRLGQLTGRSSRSRGREWMRSFALRPIARRQIVQHLREAVPGELLGLLPRADRQSQRGFDRPGKPEICIAVLPSTQSETPVPPPKSDFET